MTKNSNNKTFLPGDFIFREGEFGKVAYVIEEGDIELVKFTGDEYITLAEITKGALFGEMAIIDGSPRSGSARAKTSCILREVTEEQLKQYLSASPQTSLDMMRRLAGYARSANEKLNRDAFESSKKSEERNPWQSTTIEWSAPSPPLPHVNFDSAVEVYHGPYEYSVPGKEKDFCIQTVK